MPKIVTREFDKTKSVGPEYASFAVVVPGFVEDTTNLAVFDENGIYECSSRDDFIKNIGIAPNSTVLVASATGPVIETEFGESPKALTKDTFDNLVSKGNLYVAISKGSEPVGKLVDNSYIYEKITADNGYIFKTAADATETGSETLFAVLKNEGHDDLYETHYGNQIAYELLGLGYTILYKIINTTTDLQNSE